MSERDLVTGNNGERHRKEDRVEEGKEPPREADTIRDREIGREQEMGYTGKGKRIGEHRERKSERDTDSYRDRG